MWFVKITGQAGSLREGKKTTACKTARRKQSKMRYTLSESSLLRSKTY